jgi:hypothetical protein
MCYQTQLVAFTVVFSSSSLSFVLDPVMHGNISINLIVGKQTAEISFSFDLVELNERRKNDLTAFRTRTAVKFITKSEKWRRQVLNFV